MTVEYDTPMKGQGYIQEVKEQILKDITEQLAHGTLFLAEGKRGRDYLIRVTHKIVRDNFEELEK